MSNCELRMCATRDIEHRTFQFAVRIIRLVSALPSNTSGFVLGKQVLRSGTSVGANIEEAQGSHSRAEFVRRLNIARFEARETLYWLRLIKETDLLPPRKLSAIVREADELVSILTAIVKKSRSAKS